MWVLVFFWLFYRLIQRSSSQSLQTIPENWKLFWSTWLRCRLTLHRVSMTLYWNFDCRTGHMNKTSRFELPPALCFDGKDLVSMSHICIPAMPFPAGHWQHEAIHMLCWTNSTEMGKQPCIWENIPFRMAELVLFVCHLRTDSRQYSLQAVGLPTKVSLLACLDLWECWLFGQRKSCSVCLKGLKSNYQKWPAWKSSKLSRLSAK